MRRTFVVALGLAVVGVTGPQAALPPSQSGSSAKLTGRPVSLLIGTWKLVSIERRSVKGDLLPPAKPPSVGSPNPVGVMMYDPAGYVGYAVMHSGRQKYAGSEPTPDEAKSAFESYTSLFGTYAVDQGTRTVTFHLNGSLDPNRTNTDYRSTFDLSGNRLSLKPPPTATGVHDTLTWERIPDLEMFTATHRRLIGFWKLVPNQGDKIEPAGAAGSDQRRGFIIYTASGNMAVHIMPGARKRFAGEAPTPEEAKVALRGYSSYFGPYTVNETDGYVVHQRIAHTIPASVGTNAQRFYEFSGKRLVLRLFSTTFTVPTTIQAAKSEGREPSMITWERITEP